MFERYQRGSNRVIDILVGVYDCSRNVARDADYQAAFAIDRYRRRWRKTSKVQRLDLYLAETATALAELEGELDAPTAAGVREARSQVEWMIAEIRV